MKTALLYLLIIAMAVFIVFACLAPHQYGVERVEGGEIIDDGNIRTVATLTVEDATWNFKDGINWDIQEYPTPDAIPGSTEDETIYITDSVNWEDSAINWDSDNFLILEDNGPNATMTFEDSGDFVFAIGEKESLRICETGEFYVEERLTTVDMEVYEAVAGFFKTILKDMEWDDLKECNTDKEVEAAYYYKRGWNEAIFEAYDSLTIDGRITAGGFTGTSREMIRASIERGGWNSETMRHNTNREATQ